MKKMIILSFVIFLAGCVSQPVIKENNTKQTNNNQTNINEVLAKKTDYNRSNISLNGYIVDFYTCPECPVGVLCELCFNTITLADTLNEQADDKRIIIPYYINQISQEIKIGDVIKLEVTCPSGIFYSQYYSCDLFSKR